MTISLLPYVATFSEQCYFWRSYFFTLFQSNYFDTIVIFQGSCFFQELFFQNNHFFRSSYFFRNSYFFRVTLLARSHFLRIESSSGQLLFGTATFLAEKLFRIKIPTEELLFPSRYFCTASTFSEKLQFGKSNIPHYILFLESYLFRAATFLKDTTFYGSSVFRRATFYDIHFQKSYNFTATLPFHSYTSYLLVSN